MIHVDAETPLQVIPAGNPTVQSSGDAAENFLRIFDALSQTYDCVVIHADADTARQVERTLNGSLQLVIAVLRAGGEAGMERLANPGCQVLGYEQSGEEPRAKRMSLLERVTAT